MGSLVDSATSHTILREHKFFSNLIPNRTPLTAIWGPSNLIEGHGTDCLLSNGIEFTIKEALFLPLSGRTLLSFKDIRENNYYAETT